MMGTIDGVFTDAAGKYLFGWACGRFQHGAATIELYLNGPKGTGTLATTTTTTAGTEEYVSFLCQDHTAPHRFRIDFSPSFLTANTGKSIYVQATGVGGAPTAPLAQSGTFTVP